MPHACPSDLADPEWAILEPLVPAVKPGGRSRAHADRELLDAMLSVLRGGIAWRALPHEYPPWKTVYHYFPGVASGWELGTHERAPLRRDAGARGPIARAERVWVDAGDTGALIPWAKQELDLTLTVVKRPRRWVRVAADQESEPLPDGRTMLPRRSVVERTFAWLGRNRRLSKDDEALPTTEQAWIQLAMIRLMVARLAK